MKIVKIKIFSNKIYNKIFFFIFYNKMFNLFLFIEIVHLDIKPHNLYCCDGKAKGYRRVKKK